MCGISSSGVQPGFKSWSIAINPNPDSPTYNQTLSLTKQLERHTKMSDLTESCKTACLDQVITNSPINDTGYIFLKETQTSILYTCTCWANSICSKRLSADKTWASSNAVGTTFGRAHNVQLVRSGLVSGNLPIRRVSDEDKTSEFTCPSGVIWNVTAAGATPDNCNVTGYGNSLLTWACFRYMLYRNESMEPPDVGCCRWYTSPMVRTGPGFQPFDKEDFIIRRDQNASLMANQLNAITQNSSKSWTWTSFGMLRIILLALRVSN